MALSVIFIHGLGDVPSPIIAGVSLLSFTTTTSSFLTPPPAQYLIDVLGSIRWALFAVSLWLAWAVILWGAAYVVARRTLKENTPDDVFDELSFH